jgi:hypothetical protein
MFFVYIISIGWRRLSRRSSAMSCQNFIECKPVLSRARGDIIILDLLRQVGELLKNRFDCSPKNMHRGGGGQVWWKSGQDTLKLSACEFRSNI